MRVVGGGGQHKDWSSVKEGVLPWRVLGEEVE